MRIATVGSKVILQRAIGGFPAGSICDVIARELHDDQRGLEFVLKPRTGGGPIALDEANLVEGGFPFVLLNY